MKKLVTLIAALAVSWLGGCGYIPKAPVDPSSRPKVTLGIQDDGRRTVAVQPNPLAFPAGQGPITIVWSLPGSGPLRFAENGIVIDGEIPNRDVPRQTSDRASGAMAINRIQTEIVDCRIANGGLEFSCLNRHTRPGTFKYTIRVLEAGKPLAPLDPVVAND